MEQENVPIFFDYVETQCPVCLGKVHKIIESDHVPAGELTCESEFYIHKGDKLIKIKNPKPAWENTKEYHEASKNT